MTLATVQEGLADNIRALDHFDDRRVSINDWTILASGVPNAVILEYQEFEAEREDYAPKTLFTWTIRINLLVRYTNDVQGARDMEDRRDEIITKLLANPKLPNGEGVNTAFDSLPVSGQIADEETVEIGGVNFLQEWLTVEIEELL